MAGKRAVVEPEAVFGGQRVKESASPLPDVLLALHFAPKLLPAPCRALTDCCWLVAVLLRFALAPAHASSVDTGLEVLQLPGGSGAWELAEIQESMPSNVSLLLFFLLSPGRLTRRASGPPGCLCMWLLG
jgi:hypothetical protein